MTRTIDDYDSMARREIIKAKQEKATSYVLTRSHPPTMTDDVGYCTQRRVQKFKSDYAEFRKEFERIKEEVSLLTPFSFPPPIKMPSISAQPRNAQSSFRRAPARLSPQMPDGASPHPPQRPRI